MLEIFLNRWILSLTVLSALAAIIGCSSQTLAPEPSASITTAHSGQRASALSLQSDPRRETTAFASGTTLLDEIPAIEIQFEALILPPNLEASTILLMHMTTFRNLTATVDENSVLRGFDDEPVALGDFQICNRGLARGIVTGEDTIQLTYLRMLPN